MKGMSGCYRNKEEQHVVAGGQGSFSAELISRLNRWEGLELSGVLIPGPQTLVLRGSASSLVGLGMEGEEPQAGGGGQAGLEDADGTLLLPIGGTFLPRPTEQMTPD